MVRFLLVVACLLLGAMLGYTGAFFHLRDVVRETPSREGSQAFGHVIEEATGHTVLPIGPESDDVLEALAKAAEETVNLLNQDNSPLKGLRRINEASKYFEEALMGFINSSPQLACEIPTTTAGKAQRSGYPDLKITHLPSQRTYYLDPKLYEDSSRHSSLRTFYYTPRKETSKIHFDAHHLLIGFAHDGQDGDWTFTSWTLVDLSRTELKLKSEYNASNKVLYSAATILRQSE
ncbi:MAG: hypothetical protein Q7Q71_03815 [Verrucomicrobiota bacterium JB023]|nr:hypothetical protein [Verrucomicrobiota bacterium JB023]